MDACYFESVLKSVRLAKRAIDIAGAALGLVLTAPLMPLIAAAIYVESPGPVLFRQRRAGSLKSVTSKGGKKTLTFDEFEMHKFRTMIMDAEKHTGPVFANQEDDRITAVGRFLRKSRLDEVPQLWNVLRGEMSLVGPRPERPEFVEMLAQRYPHFRLRAAVKPGVTGWAQVHGIGRGADRFSEEALSDRVEWDNYYIENWSFWLDVKIALMTVAAVLSFRQT